MSFLLQQILREPSLALQLNNDQLHQLLSQARSARLLASVAHQLQSKAVDTQLPAAASRHLQSAILIHEKQKRDLAFDGEKIRQVLDSIGERLVLLKGAAYMLAELPVGSGRLITDIDILVPQRSIIAVEKAFNESGWSSGYVNNYNQRYYRKWSHEIPPLTNRKRGTTLDVHHNVLPPTARPNVNANLFFDRLIEVKPGIFTLSWQDMVIHSATHLFHEGEFQHGLRDLWDLDRMLRDFPVRDPRFWEGLVSRARELELQVSLFYGLTYAQQLFGTPLPEGIVEDTGIWSTSMRKPVMNFLFSRAFRPDHPQCKLPYTNLALNILYVRSHLLRMPLHLLLPHLARKAWMRLLEEDGRSHQSPKIKDL